MAQKTYNILNYGKEYKQAFLELLSDTTTRITLPDEIDGVQYSLGKERWDGDTNLEYIDFNKCDIIPPKTCNECSNLTQAVFSTHTTEIGNYAFYNCTKFEDTELPHTLTNIGEYAFYNVGSSYSRNTHTFTMIDDVGVHTTVGYYAFYQSHLSELRAYLNNVGSYAFYRCQSLSIVDVEIHGSIGSMAFGNDNYITSFRISPDSVITSINSQAFYYLAQNNYQTATIAPFDFRNSTFTSLPSEVWGGNYIGTSIYLPSTLQTITGNFLNQAQNNWKIYFNSVPTVSSSSYLRNDSGNFTVKYFFPYDLLSQVSVATNWSSHTSQMVGYGSGFEAGVTLPVYLRTTGVSLTWYSDESLTTQITTSSSATDVYYCTLGTLRAVWFIDTLQLVDASVTISDGSNLYVAGDPVLVNTSLTISSTYTDPTKNQLYLLKVNGIDYTTSGSATITMTQDLTITAVYWNGTDLPFLPILSDNSWEQIKLASISGNIPSTWNVGDTKTLTYNNQTYTARLVDKTGKFTRTANNSVAYLSFEFVNSLPEDVKWDVSGGLDFANSTLFAAMNSGNIWNNLDNELQTLVEPVNIPVAATSSSMKTISGKLFIPRAQDIFDYNYWAAEIENQSILVDQYYANNTTGSNFVKNPLAKKKVGPATSTGANYWLMTRSYRYGGGSMICGINTGGEIFPNSPGGTYKVVVRFVL